MGRCSRDSGHRISRRSLLKLGAVASCAGIVGLCPKGSPGLEKSLKAPLRPGGPGHVVEVHMPGMRGKQFPHPEAAAAMVQSAVATLAREPDPARAWAKFIRKDDKVAIKINCLGGRLSSTMKEVVDPIVEGVRSAGVPDANILIFDQFGGSMRAARYALQEKEGRLRVMSHDRFGYEQAWTEVEGGRGKLSKALTWATAVINVPVIKDHDLAGAGITCAMKNLVFGSVEKPQLLHREIAVALPHFYARDEIRGRSRLTIVDGSFCLYDGGPKHNGAAHVTHDRVYASTDPVAIDAIALEVVEDYRRKNSLKSLEAARRPATFLPLAEKLGLGVARRDKIFLEQVELPPFAGPPA